MVKYPYFVKYFLMFEWTILSLNQTQLHCLFLHSTYLPLIHLTSTCLDSYYLLVISPEYSSISFIHLISSTKWFLICLLLSHSLSFLTLKPILPAQFSQVHPFPFEITPLVFVLILVRWFLVLRLIFSAARSFEFNLILPIFLNLLSPIIVITPFLAHWF